MDLLRNILRGYPLAFVLALVLVFRPAAGRRPGQEAGSTAALPNGTGRQARQAGPAPIETAFAAASVVLLVLDVVLALRYRGR